MLTLGIGTFLYMAPEVLSSNLYTKMCDVYSYGMILIELLSGDSIDLNPAFQGMSSAKLIVAIAHEGLRPNLDNSQIPRLLCTLIDETLLSDPENRPSFAEIVTRLKRFIRTLD